MNIPELDLKRAEQTSLPDNPVDALLENMRYPDLTILRESVAVFKRIARTVSGFPAVRPADCMRITDLLRKFYLDHNRQFVALDSYLINQFIGLIAEFRNSDIYFYPTEVFRLELLKAEVLVAIGRDAEALEIVEPFAQRPYLVEDDFGLITRVMEIDSLARLSSGRLDELCRVSIGRIRLLSNWRPTDSHYLFRALAAPLSLGRDETDTFTDTMIRKTARLYQFLKRIHARYAFMRFGTTQALETSLAFWAGEILMLTRRRLYAARVQIRHEEASGKPVLQQPVPLPPGKTKLTMKERPILVTRAMGGLGDVAMMTPGVNALARRYGGPIYFATKKSFFPLFENNPDVKLLDVDSYFDMGQFRRWYNLSNCPASRYEVKAAPFIKKSRVETFAQGMKVSRWQLYLHGWTPHVRLSEAPKTLAAKFREDFAADGRPLVGVQPYSRDSYKNCDAIFEAARKLSETHRVVMMHTSPLPIEANENLIVLIGRPLREALAITAALDYYVAVDSAFYHLTAAFDIPVLGIFGPTDGKTLSKHVKRHRLVRGKLDFPCAPCWRNEDTPCALTGTNRSACLTSIDADTICRDFEALKQKYPMGGDKRP